MARMGDVMRVWGRRGEARRELLVKVGLSWFLGPYQVPTPPQLSSLRALLSPDNQRLQNLGPPDSSNRPEHGKHGSGRCCPSLIFFALLNR